MFKLPEIDITRTSAIIQNFIRTRLEESPCEGYVIGLSGGIDSATSASLLVKAVGAHKVKAFFMPTSTTPEGDLEDVEKLCQQLGISLEKVNLQQMLEIFSTITNTSIDSKTPEWSNFKARMRAVILYFFANKYNYLVCGNGNKSEIMIGYYTKFGDGAADIIPLGDLYKKYIIDLAVFLNVPPEIVNKPPSAGLWEGQTDEDELGITYELLDKVLFLIEHFKNDDEITTILQIPKETVIRVRKMIYQSEHKRRGPILLKLSVRTPNIDWRIPLVTPSKYKAG